MENKQYFTMIQIRNGMDKICEQMDKAGFQPDVVMGINRGGCIPGIYMSHRLHVPHEVLDVRLRDHKATPNLDNLNQALNSSKKVLVIDDINDSDATFKHITEAIGSNDNLKFASIIHNDPSEFDKLDYWCYNINKKENPVWIVFPWEQW